MTAFAQKVITVGADVHMVVQSQLAPTEDVWQIRAAHSGWKRMVAFYWDQV